MKSLYQTHQSFETIGPPSGMTGAFPIYGSESKWVVESLYHSEWWTPLHPYVRHTVLPALIACHLRGQTSRSTVWANGTQNSGLVNFVPESCLLFVQISFIFRKTTAKAWRWCQRWLWKNGTRISVWNISSGKIGLPFPMFRCSRKFATETTRPKKSCSI